MNNEIISALLLTLKLSFFTSVLLILICLPLAFYVIKLHWSIQVTLKSLASLPLFLPPTILGFFLLIAMSPDGVVGAITEYMGIGTLNFTFSGILIGTSIFSFPFVFHPLYTFFESLGDRPFEIGAMFGFSRFKTFIRIIVPMSFPTIFLAFVLSFSNSIGEFGVVLMVGGSIPNETRVLSIAIYELVESLKYDHVYFISSFLLASSFLVLFIINFKYMSRRKLL